MNNRMVILWESQAIYVGTVSKSVSDLVSQSVSEWVTGSVIYPFGPISLSFDSYKYDYSFFSHDLDKQLNTPRHPTPLTSSLFKSPAIIRINVVLPVPFSPNITTISESVKAPP